MSNILLYKSQFKKNMVDKRPLGKGRSGKFIIRNGNTTSALECHIREFITLKLAGVLHGGSSLDRLVPLKTS